MAAVNVPDGARYTVVPLRPQPRPRTRTPVWQEVVFWAAVVVLGLSLGWILGSL